MATLVLALAIVRADNHGGMLGRPAADLECQPLFRGRLGQLASGERRHLVLRCQETGDGQRMFRVDLSD